MYQICILLSCVKIDHLNILGLLVINKRLPFLYCLKTSGLSLLMIAVQENQLHVVQRLLELEVNPGEKTKVRTPTVTYPIKAIDKHCRLGNFLFPHLCKCYIQL